MRWFVEYWLLVFLVPLVNATDHLNSVINKRRTHSFMPKRYDRSARYQNTFADDHVSNASQSHHLDYLIRVQRAAAVIQAPSALRLIDEKQCPEIRNLCGNLRDGTDDLSVLECVQTFLTNQIESISDDCHHSIWTHTKDIMSDGVVLQLVEKPCQNVVGK